MKTWKTTYAQLPLFDGIAEDDLIALMDCLKKKEHLYKKGEYILLASDHVQNIGIVLSGTVHMLKEDIWGHQTLMTYMGSGELFGETFALRKERDSSVSFLAAQDTKILFLTVDRLLFPCEKCCPFHALLARNMFHLMSEKNIRLIERIEVSSKNSLREKILAYLSMQAQKQGSRYITIPLNRSEMANYLHSNRSAMVRELAAMKTEGILDFDGDTFQILK